MGFGHAEMWTAPDGARLALRREPATAARRGAMVFVHGWGDYAGRYEELARWSAARGLDVYAVDQRGHGLSPGPRGHVERFAQYLSDLSALRRLAAAEAPGPQVLVGHSFGGFIVLRYLETSPNGVAGAAVAAPYVDFHRPPAAWKVMLARAVKDILPRLAIPTGLGWELTTRDGETWRSYRDDPLAHQLVTPRAYAETLRSLGALHGERHRIATATLFLLAGEDRICSTAAARSFAASLPGDVMVNELPGMYHNLFHEPDRERVYAALGPWLDRVLGG